MKSFFAIAAGVLAAASQVAAVTIVTPWASTTWTSGEHGAISWNTTAADASLKCDIQLLNGNFTNANLVAAITATGTPIACSAGAFDIYPLNDFATGKYWIRIGQADTNAWAYSGEFSFVGKGSANPYSIVGTPSAVAAAATPSGTAAAVASAMASGVKTTGLPNAAAAASASASASTKSTSGASGFTMSKAAVAMGAVAAVALTL